MTNAWEQNNNGNWTKMFGDRKVIVYELKDDYGTRSGEWSYCILSGMKTKFVDAETEDFIGLMMEIDEEMLEQEFNEIMDEADGDLGVAGKIMKERGWDA